MTGVHFCGLHACRSYHFWLVKVYWSYSGRGWRRYCFRSVGHRGRYIDWGVSICRLHKDISNPFSDQEPSYPPLRSRLGSLSFRMRRPLPGAISLLPPLVSPVPMQRPRMQPALEDRPIVGPKPPVPLFAVTQIAGVGCEVFLVLNGLEKAQSSFVQIAASSH